MSNCSLEISSRTTSAAITLDVGLRFVVVGFGLADGGEFGLVVLLGGDDGGFGGGDVGARGGDGGGVGSLRDRDVGIFGAELGFGLRVAGFGLVERVLIVGWIEIDGRVDWR